MQFADVAQWLAFKGTVSWKLRRVKSSIIKKLFSMGGDARQKRLILLKWHFAFYKKKFSVCMGQTWKIVQRPYFKTFPWYAMTPQTGV